MNQVEIEGRLLPGMNVARMIIRADELFGKLVLDRALPGRVMLKDFSPWLASVLRDITYHEDRAIIAANIIAGYRKQVCESGKCPLKASGECDGVESLLEKKGSKHVIPQVILEIRQGLDVGKRIKKESLCWTRD